MNDEYEQEVYRMLDDLAAANAIPDSIRYANEAAVRAIAAGAFGRPILVERFLVERRDG